MNAICDDITTLTVDAIVNAANSSLLGGGGVDGAIHRAAGRSLSTNAGFLEAAKPARPKLSKGYNLPAKFIIHTVGPVWNGGDSDEERLLASCYSESLAIAESHAEIDSIAFPCISTGIFGFPAEAAARIAVESCKNATLSVTFCCFSQKDLGLYRALLAIS